MFGVMADMVTVVIVVVDVGVVLVVGDEVGKRKLVSIVPIFGVIGT